MPVIFLSVNISIENILSPTNTDNKNFCILCEFGNKKMLSNFLKNQPFLYLRQIMHHAVAVASYSISRTFCPKILGNYRNSVNRIPLFKYYFGLRFPLHIIYFKKAIDIRITHKGKNDKKATERLIFRKPCVELFGKRE